MNRSEKYTSAQVVPRASIDAYGEDFIKYIADSIIRDLSEKVLDRAKFSDVIVSLKPVKITEYTAWDQVEYRRNITVTNLVRCKDCKWWEELEDVKGLKFCTYVVGAEFVREGIDFCSRGERKEYV